MTITLPQNDTNTKRASELADVRKDYAYDFTYGFPVGTKYYDRDKDALVWWTLVLKNLQDNRDNTEAILQKTGWKTSRPIPSLDAATFAFILKTKDFPNAFDFFLPDVGYIQGGGRPTSLDDYMNVFQLVDPTVYVKTTEDDAYFAHSYVAGPHSRAFERMKAIPANFPITNEIYKKTKELASDDLNTAIAAGRVYFADYRELGDLVNGMHPLQKKYIYQPIVAFAVPPGGKDIVPFAIQCGQTTAGNPIFTPGDEWAWKMAKAVCWSAHYTYHECLSHLGLTHLLVEPIVVATRRQLHESHPIYSLLSPHFEGTMVINSMAMSSLIQENQAVDRLVGAGIKSCHATIAKVRLAYSFKSNYFPNRLREHGLYNKEKLPNYHYRDDGILVWNALRAFVSRYVDRAYPADADVKADTELQAWAAEIASNDGGRIKDFAANGGVEDKDMLIDTCTMIMFTAGPQHAAVNFPQKNHMAYLPGTPLAGYRPAPDSAQMTEKDFLDILPPLDVAIKQWQTMFFLGSVHYTTLGDYGDIFKDTVFQAASAKFKEDLARIEVEIKNRNLTRTPYEALLPSLIPQSINI